MLIKLIKSMLISPILATGVCLIATYIQFGQLMLSESILILIIVYLSTLFFGPPAFLIFRKMNWRNWWQFTSFGLLIAAICINFLVAGAMPFLFSYSVSTFLSIALDFWSSLIAGAVVGYSFWLFTRDSTVVKN